MGKLTYSGATVLFDEGGDSSTLQAPSPQDFSLDPFAGFTFSGKPILALTGVIAQIDSGQSQHIAGNNTITYTFLREGKDLIGLYNNPKYGFTSAFGLSAFSAAQQAEARQSIQLWDDLIAPKFREVTGAGADIQFANSFDPSQAYAYYPEYLPGGKNGFTNAQGYKFFGDVFTASPSINWTNNWLDYGGYGAFTLVHEIGHAIGLSHPGAYNGAGATTYADQAEYAQDSEQYTVMSYWDDSETSNQPFTFGNVDWSTLFYNNPQTPLIHDILTVQAKYGADPTTRAGNTTYGWNSNAGNEVYDFSVNKFPYLSIYDAGGIDTIDMSGAGASVMINLNQGTFSSGAAAVPNAAEVNANRAEIDAIFPGTVGPVSQATMTFYQTAVPNAYASIIAFETGITGIGTTSHDNLSIAYGTVIENAIGSSKRDLLIGNEVNNVLTGNGGADVFMFLHGNNTDTITDFAVGVDKVDLTAFGITAAQVAFSAGAVSVASLGLTILTPGATLSSSDITCA